LSQEMIVMLPNTAIAKIERSFVTLFMSVEFE
jgi:hypothetical protein